MGSIVKTFSEHKIKGFGGRDYSVPMYIQFVPGTCFEVVSSIDSYGYNGEESINTIFAEPHIKEKFWKTRGQIVGSEDQRYWPLFRSPGEVPSKGDPVLLCTIGYTNYYLGPLNMKTNSPTWNIDPNFRSQMTVNDAPQKATSMRSKTGESHNFNKNTLFRRLHKNYNSDLDFGKTINETQGDMVMEGRHGNSIRIGSRSDNPYIFFSNHRFYNNAFESVGDGSLIGILSNGTIAQHFGGYYDIDPEKVLNPKTPESEDALFDESKVIPFQLSSDTVEENNYPIGDIYTSVNGYSDSSFIYSYDGNQMLFHSDRIILNSKLDDIYVSSIKDIHIGAGRFTTISAGKNIIFETPELSIGDPERASGNMQPMVLGDNLKQILTEILDLIPSIKITTQLGVQSPLPDAQVKVDNLKRQLDTVLSDYYNIEAN